MKVQGDNMQTNTKEALNLIKELGEVTKKYNLIREKLEMIYPFDELMDWGVTGVYPGCTIKDDMLYDSQGELLSDDGRCMDEGIPYFVNQTTGYLGDDYHGTMFIKVDDENTFVAITYEC